jgi:hypothetical protein
VPSYKVHAVGAVVAQILVLLILAVAGIWHCPSVQACWILLWAVMGGLFPDIDTKSKIQRPFYITLACTIIWLISFGDKDAALALALLGYTPLMVHHRGLFHAWWLYAGAGFIAVIWWLQAGYTCASQQLWLYSALLAWAWGALVHIMLDRW